MADSVLEHIEIMFLQKGMMIENLCEPGTSRIAIKVHKVGSRNNASFLKFSPEKFSILYLTDDNSLIIETYLYNEQLIESRREDLAEWYENGLEGSCDAIDYVVKTLNTPDTLCQGVQIKRMSVPDVSMVLVEAYNNRIIYRSRNCKRIIAPHHVKSEEMNESSILSDLCEECTCLLQPVLKMEEQEQEFYNTDDPLMVEEEDIIVHSIFSDESLIQRKRKRQSSHLINKDTKDITKQQAISCQQCGLSFDGKKSLHSHMSQAHPDSVRCPVSECTAVFNEYLGVKMRNHLGKEHADAENLEIGCGKCNSTLNSVKSFQLHQQDCAAVYTCNTCTKTYGSYKYFTMHRCKGMADLTPICMEPGCGKIFKLKSSLKDHIKYAHSTENQFVCSGCGKAYRNRQKRKTCENVHLGKFLHPCTLCDKKFNCKRRFEQHMRTHTGEKPYVCPVCSYRCSRLDNLNIHCKKSHDMTTAEAEQATGMSCKLDTRQDEEVVLHQAYHTGDNGGSSLNALTAPILATIGEDGGDPLGLGGGSHPTTAEVLNLPHNINTAVQQPTLSSVIQPSTASAAAVNSVINVAQVTEDTSLPSLTTIQSEQGLGNLDGSLPHSDLPVSITFLSTQHIPHKL